MAKKLFIILALLPFVVLLINMTVFHKDSSATQQGTQDVSATLRDINKLES